MEYKVISADCHIDIPWLPADLFVSQAPSKLKEHMPRVVETKEGKQWVAEGQLLAWVAGAGLTGAWNPYVPGLSSRLDRMEEEGKFFSEGQRGLFHPTTPELRIKDQKLDGLDAEVIYGILALGGAPEEGAFTLGASDAPGGDTPGVGYGLTDPEVITVTYDIYNEWVVDLCKSNTQRFAGLACITSHDPKIAANQLRRAAQLGLRGAELNVSGAVKPIYHKDWDILWATAAECNMPISFHTLGLTYRQPDASEMEEYQWVNTGLGFTLFQLSGAEFLTSIIYSGACERYPDFKFVLGECGIGWIPYMLYRLDDEYDRLSELKLNLKPSEYWRRQGYSTFQTETVTPELVSLVGEDNIMWGSDYPHPDGVFPDSQKVIREGLGQLDERVRHKIVCETAAKLYGFK